MIELVCVHNNAMSSPGDISPSVMLSIVIKTPYEAVQDLTETVIDMELPSVIEKGLTDNLTSAQTLIKQEKYLPARKRLNAFFKQVKAQTGKAIIYDSLIESAQQIIYSITPQ